MSDVRETWCSHLGDELRFWDTYLGSGGHKWPDEFAQRVDGEAPLAEQEIVKRIPRGRDRVRILDVGAGPLTILGKRLPGVAVELTAVDPLAAQYDELLGRYGIVPPVRTQWCEGEQLASKFAADTFDFAYARNALDHAHDPRSVIAQMVAVVKPGGWVILRHRPNEAESAQYKGLHQWNFELRDGRFWIRGREASHDMAAVLKRVAEVTSRSDGPWVVCVIQKRQRAQGLLRRIFGQG